MFKNDLNIEDVRALFFDDTALREPTYRLYRATGKERWYYEPDGDAFYPSVTTVIGATTPMSYGLQQYLMDHRDPEGYRDERAAYGTWLHKAAAAYLIEGEYDLDNIPASLEIDAIEAGLNPSALDWHDRAKKDILAWALFCREHSVRPLAIEVMLKSEDGYAGAVDLVCRMTIGSGANGNFLKRDDGGEEITAIIDIKSGKIYPDHAIQLHMYKQMVEENWPDMRIDRVFNWTSRDWRTTPSYQINDQTDSDEQHLIPHLVGQFKARNASGPSSSLVVGGVLRGENIETCYKHQNLRDRFKEKNEANDLFSEVGA